MRRTAYNIGLFSICAISVIALVAIWAALLDAGQASQYGIQGGPQGYHAASGGGGAPSWTPASATMDGGVTPAHWFKADAGTYQDSSGVTVAASDGDVVGNWADQAASGVSLMQATTGNKPTLQTAELNGKSTIRSAGNNYLRGGFQAVVSQPYTVFVVAKLDIAAVNDGNIRALVDGADATNRLMLLQYSPATPDSWTIAATTALDGGASDSNWNIWTVLVNGATSQFWHNGTSEAVGAAGSASLGGLTFGAFYNNTFPWLGDVAEIIIYSGNLSTADKNQLGQYLDDEYGITYTDIP